MDDMAERSGLKLVLKDKRGKVKTKLEFVKGKWVLVAVPLEEGR